MQQQIIYTPNPRRTKTRVKPSIKSKRKVTIHITTETLKNKLLGVSLIAVGIFSAKLTGDGTAAVMTLFLGLSAIFSK